MLVLNTDTLPIVKMYCMQTNAIKQLIIVLEVLGPSFIGCNFTSTIKGRKGSDMINLDSFSLHQKKSKAI